MLGMRIVSCVFIFCVRRMRGRGSRRRCMRICGRLGGCGCGGMRIGRWCRRQRLFHLHSLACRCGRCNQGVRIFLRVGRCRRRCLCRRRVSMRTMASGCWCCGYRMSVRRWRRSCDRRRCGCVRMRCRTGVAISGMGILGGAGHALAQLQSLAGFWGSMSVRSCIRFVTVCGRLRIGAMRGGRCAAMGRSCRCMRIM